MKAAPAGGQRPQVDPNKVYTIPIGTSPLHGPKEAKATTVEAFLKLNAGKAGDVIRYRYEMNERELSKLARSAESMLLA